jgi:hypothetical protein
VYDVLRDLRPRAILTKSGKPKMLILPASGADEHTPATVLWYEKGRKTLSACDLHFANTEQLFLKANQGEGYQQFFAYMHQMSVAGEPLGLYRVRPEVNLHSLYNTEVMREVFKEKVNEKLAKYGNRVKVFLSESPTNVQRLVKAEGLQCTQIAHEAFQIAIKVANSEVKRALKSFLREVPDYILEPLWNCDESYVEDFRYAKEGATEHEQIKRIRWLLTFPLYRKLADQDDALPLIDTNQFTEGAIADRCGVSAAHIRRLRGLPFSRLTWFGQLGATELTQVLADVNINHIPQSDKVSQSEIDTFVGVVAKTVCLTHAGKSGPMANYAARKLLKNTAGRWLALNAKATSDEVEKASDFIQSFSMRTILPALFRLGQPANEFVESSRTCTDVVNFWQGVSRELLLAALSETWNLGTVIAAYQSWHKVVGQSSFRGALSMWPALCPTLTAPNRVQLIPLTNSAELAEEGSAMHHCVGGYTSQCLSGNSHIFSIRDSNGIRLSTLQLQQHGRVICLRQNRSAGNGQAPEIAVQAGLWIERQIQCGAIEIDWDNLLEQQLRMRINAGTIQVLGFDPEDSVTWNKAFCEFKGMCPKHLRTESVEQFVVSVLRLLKQKGAPTHPIAATLLDTLESSLS